MAVDLNYEKDSKERIPYEHYLEVYQNADPAEISSRCTACSILEMTAQTVR